MAHDTNTDSPSRLPPGWYLLGLLALLVSIGASAVLAAKQLDLFDAPGCGDGSPCDQAAASVWGKIPGLGWPTSFVGLAYFVALAVAWTAALRVGGFTPAFRNVVRAGVAASVVFLLAMIFGGYVCAYCVAAHVGNFAFLAVLETAPRGAGRTASLATWGAAAFVVVSAVEFGADAAAEQKQRAIADESTQQIKAAMEAGVDDEGFTGRWLIGPENAPIRLVIISDYQCPDCKRIENEAMALVESRGDVSLSAKHHPFCTDCNPHVRNNAHPNACWAARAAEAAGILRGNEGFWAMHRWLFERSGMFFDDVLHRHLREQGYDVRRFLQVMEGEETLQRVRDDIEEAQALGIHYTPMIFINGTQFRGFGSEGALTRAVLELAATNPPPGDPTMDRPPPAGQKFIDDWAAQPVRNLSGGPRSWTLGPEDAAVEIVAWGDYQEPFTGQGDALIRGLVVGRGDVRYTFRHFAINKACNPASPKTMHPQACLAHRAAEAAGILGGAEGYWRMHEWLMANREGLDEAALRRGAAELGVDYGALAETMNSSEVATAIATDGRAAMRTGLRGVPFVFVNGRHVPRWNREGALEAIVEAAAAQASTSG